MDGGTGREEDGAGKVERDADEELCREPRGVARAGKEGGNLAVEEHDEGEGDEEEV